MSDNSTPKTQQAPNFTLDGSRVRHELDESHRELTKALAPQPKPRDDGINQGDLRQRVTVGDIAERLKLSVTSSLLQALYVAKFRPAELTLALSQEAVRYERRHSARQS
jgi:hypothetical protein